MGKKGLVLFLLVVGIGLFAFSQNEITYVYADSVTYRMYSEKDWDDLIKLGKRYLKHNESFYYLDLRMGYAYLMKRKYFRAVKFFEDAYKVNPDNEFLRVNLYFSYLGAGLVYSAYNLAKKIPNAEKQKYGINDSFVKDVSFEYSSFPNNDIDRLSNADYIEENNPLAFGYLDKTYRNKKIGFTFQLSDNLFWGQNIELLTSDRYFFRQTFFNKEIIPLTTKQNRVFGKFIFNKKRNSFITLSYNLVWGNSDMVDTFDILPNREIQLYVVNYKQYSFGVSYTKQIGFFRIKPAINLFKSYDGGYLYAGSEFTLLPLGNTDLYLTGSIYYSLRNRPNNPFITKSEAGFRLWKFNFFGTYYYGSIHNFVENDGEFIFNFEDTMNSAFGGGVSFSTKKLTLYFVFLPSSFTFEYYNKTPANTKIYKGTYTKNLIKGGLIWKF